MKYFIIFFAIMIHNGTSYAEDCTYDQSSQISLLQSIAKSHPGGELDKQSKSIVWNSDLNSASSITYGGCHHLSFSVTKNVSVHNPLRNEELFLLASTLAREYWDKSDANSLSKGIKDKTYTREITAGSMYYNIPHEYYFEFYIEHNPLKAYVTIFWARNF